MLRDNQYDLRCGDAVDMMRTLPPESIDLVVTDPPYESLEKHRAVGTTTPIIWDKQVMIETSYRRLGAPPGDAAVARDKK